MGFERRRGGFRVSVQQGVIDLYMLGEHLLQLRGALIGFERRMRDDEEPLAAQNRVEQYFVGTMRQSILMKIAFDPLEFGRRDLTVANSLHSLAPTDQLAGAQLRKRLAKRLRLQQPTKLKMAGDVFGRQRPGVPALVAVLNRNSRSFELSEHLMRDSAADVVVLGESAFVEKETPIDEACRD